MRWIGGKPGCEMGRSQSIASDEYCCESVPALITDGARLSGYVPLFHQGERHFFNFFIIRQSSRHVERFQLLDAVL